MEICLKKLLSTINNVKRKKVLVIGDIFLDEYLYGNVHKISNGFKVPIMEIEKRIYNLGGAGNIAANIAGLSKETYLLGFIGNDENGNIIKRICTTKNITLLGHKEKSTITKCRIIIDNQQILRIDENKNKINANFDLYNLLDNLNPNIVIIADYSYGTISQQIINISESYCKKKNLNLYFTSRDINKFNIDNYPIIILNNHEFKAWSRYNHNQKCFITNGKLGITFIDTLNNITKNCQRKEIKNPSGAGDSAMAIISLLYDEGISVDNILTLANICGELAVQYKETYSLQKYDIISAYFEYLVSQNCLEKIVNFQVAKQITKIWKNCGQKIVLTNGCFDIIHSGHLHSLSESKKYGDKLIVAINSDESIKQLKGEGRPINNIVERSSALAYLDCVDLIICFNSTNAIQIIKELNPDIYTKGEEYKHKNFQESKYAKSIIFTPMIKKLSSSSIIDKINRR